MTARLGPLRPIFPTSSKMGIPELIPGMLSNRVPASHEIVLRGTAAMNAGLAGKVLACWTDDFRFYGCWTKPTLFVEGMKCCGIRTAIEPDFSVYSTDPMAEQIHAIYRIRWVGRWWQENGVEVIPNLAWGDERSFEFAWDGIPKGCPVVGIEARPRGKDRQAFLTGARKAIETVQPTNVLLYGSATGTERELPQGPEYHRIEAWSVRRRMEFVDGNGTKV